MYGSILRGFSRQEVIKKPFCLCLVKTYQVLKSFNGMLLNTVETKMSLIMIVLLQGRV